jgi:hypothetical protein
MIKKEDLLARLQADRQTLLKTIEGAPDEALTMPEAIGMWSVLDVLAHITAWDGETLRRIAFATGESPRPPHDVDDEVYWLAWNEQQVEMKRVMGPRGIKVDLASTWTRLLARIESLSPLDYARWLEVDPYFAQERHDLEHAHQLRAWRKRWEQSLPWRQRWQGRLMKIKKTLSLTS